MVASLLSSAEILASPHVAARRAPISTRDFAYTTGSIRHARAGGAEIIAKGIDQSTMSFPAVISTPDIDRVGDSLNPLGCDVTEYQDNPLVLLNHDSGGIPIGVSMGSDGKLYVAVEPERVLARCFLVQGGKFGEDAEDIFHLILQRAFNCVSVGFNPHPDPRFTKHLDTGGNRYEKWTLLEWSLTAIPCNPAAQIIRKYLTDGRITGKAISPRLVKCLTPLAEPKIEQVTSGFAAPSPSAAQSTPSPRGHDPMSKKWGKTVSKTETKHIRHEANREEGHQWVLYNHDMTKVLGTHPSKEAAEAQEEAIKSHEKAMSESSGTDGGYVTKEEEAAPPLPEETEEEHEENAEGKDEPGTGEAEADKIEEEETDEDKVHKGIRAEYSRKAQLAYHLGRGRAIIAMKSLLPKVQKDALEECVHHKIPIIAHEHSGMEQAQIEAIAFSMCHESKAFGDYQNKEEEDEQPATGNGAPQNDAPAGDELPGEANVESIPIDVSSNKRPGSLELLQRLIETIETDLPGLEPEQRQFFDDLCGHIRDYGQERFPDEGFGGSEPEEEPTPEEHREFADEVVDHYRRRPDDYTPANLERQQRLAFRKSMSVLRRGQHPEIIKEAADHCHAMSHKALGYSMTKQDKALFAEHGRALDGVHGAVKAYMKDEEEEPDEREMENESGHALNVTDDKEPEGTEDEHDEASHEIEKLFAAAVTKSAENDTVVDGNATLERMDALRERMTNIFGTRF